MFRKKSEWMKGSDSKKTDNPQQSGHQHSDVKVEHLYIRGKSLASLWDGQLNTRA